MRLPLLDPQTLDPQRRALYDELRRDVATKYGSLFTTTTPRGEFVGPWNAMLHAPHLGRHAAAFSRAFGAIPQLPRTVREVAILRVGARYRAAYELYAHEAIARAAGLADDVVTELAAGERPAALTPPEALAFDVASALLDGGVLPADRYDAAVAAFGAEGAIELVYLVGFYAFVSCVLNGFDVPVPEDGGAA